MPAYAIVNPNRRDCEFASKSMAVLVLRTIDELAAQPCGAMVSSEQKPEPNLGSLVGGVRHGGGRGAFGSQQSNTCAPGFIAYASWPYRPGIRALVELAKRISPNSAPRTLAAVGPDRAAGRLDDMVWAFAVCLRMNLWTLGA